MGGTNTEPTWGSKWVHQQHNVPVVSVPYGVRSSSAIHGRERGLSVTLFDPYFLSSSRGVRTPLGLPDQMSHTGALCL